MAQRIEDYGLIGDCRTAALVGRDGSIDWLCWPRFDGGACFASILGDERHGRWLLAPAGATSRVTRRYVEDTLILETEHETPEGVVRVTDFMAIGADASSIVRMATGVRGTVRMRVELVLRFDYGLTVPWVTRADDGGLRAISGPHLVLMRSPVEMRGVDMKSVGEFVVVEGQVVPFTLTYAASHLADPDAPEPRRAMRDTERFWRDWSGRCEDFGDLRPAVRRSLITLKALTYGPTGGIVAAPTASLPEAIGGPRNWDYRFCWLRDATLALLALMNAGYYDEAQSWGRWLLRAAAGSPDQLQNLYGVAGERDLREWQIPWLPGYEASAPVRIGNAAVDQLQIDVFGEILDALHQGRVGGLGASPDSWNLECALLAHLEQLWREPDEGIWEVRGGRRHFTYSKVMCWVAFDRAIRSAEQFGLDGPLESWRATRDAIHEEVCAKAYDATVGAFMQSYGSPQLDASVLKLPLVGFIAADDPRVASTIAAIEKGLMRDGLVRRYDAPVSGDGLPGDEGAFLACSFWLADNYILVGRFDDAQAMIDRLLALRNDLGLLSEEYDLGAKRLVGNFPQAFSHIALVTTAANLSHSKKPMHQRCEQAS